MYHELTNLLPPDRSRALRQEYFARLGVVAVVLLAVLILIHGVLLLPTYLAIREELSYETERIQALSAGLSSTEDKEVGARLARLAEDTAYLTEQSKAPSGSASIRAVLAVSRPGVALSSIAFSLGTAGENRIVLTGVASTRDSLRRYSAALSGQPSVTRVDLPISTYAKETDLPFTITLQGTFAP